MIQVFHNANFPMMGRMRWVFFAISTVAMLVALWAIIFHGFNYGIDFAGGTAVELKFRDKPNVQGLRAALEKSGLGDISIQAIGKASENEVLIRVEKMEGDKEGQGEGSEVSQIVLEALRTREEREAIQAGRIDLNMTSEALLRDWLAAHLGGAQGAGEPAAIAAALQRYRNQHGGLFNDMAEVAAVPGVTPEAARVIKDQTILGAFALRGVEFVGPTAGKELLKNTGLAILGSVGGILIYVWFRFRKIAWGISSVLALIHDVTIAAGAVALSGKEFSLPVVAALLTILGYSINDTIVVFDRIRENLRLYRDVKFPEVVNASINQTLSRTVLTSFTVFIAVFALFLYGGEKLNPLSFCLLVGVVFGTYSSVFVAAALLVVAWNYLGPKHVRL